MQIPDILTRLVGFEHELQALPQALKAFSQSLGSSQVGAYQVNCSDETEKEAVDAFDQEFVHELLPDLKFSSRSAFRSANLGARYEQGAIAIAESHFATPASMDTFKTLVVKLNAHVSVQAGPAGPVYGQMERYAQDSAACGALRAVIDGSDLPFARALREAFLSRGIDRLATLSDPARVPRHEQALVAAICSCRLQADRLLEDLHQQVPRSPTVFLLSHGVTINRPGPDTEVCCGFIQVDTRTDPWTVARAGFGDDPSRIQVIHDNQGIRLQETG